MRTWRTTLAVALAATLVPSAASAQWRFTTFAGGYVPATEFAKLSVTGGTASARIALKQQTGFVLGINANRWFQDRFGFEGTLGYVNSDVKLSGAVSGTGFGDFAGSDSRNAYLVLTGAKLLYRFTPMTAKTEFYGGIGPAAIFSGGKAYDEVGGAKLDRNTEIGGTLSFGARVPINDLVAFKLGADGFFYSAKAKVTDRTDPTSSFKFDSRMQSDFLVSAGLSFTLPGR